MAKRQNFVVGSINPNTNTWTSSELNNGWDKYQVLYSGDLDGVFNAVSDSSNDSSQEIANAIQALTGAQPTGASQNELAGALQQMREDIETSSLTFKGYVATSAPSSSTYALVEGNIWINSATMPTTFPVAASSIKLWNGTSWVNYGSTYTPSNFDFFRNINDNEGYYWFGGVWTVMSTDMSTTYFTLNQTSGKWEIKSSVNLPGAPTTTTAATTDDSTKIATTAFVKNVLEGYVPTGGAANTSLSNLVDAGKNISNWSSNITNCITNIPQDINVTITNGNLIMNAGSKVYFPNGSDTFDSFTLPSNFGSGDISGMVYDYLFFVNPTKTGLVGSQVSNCYSGSTAPTGANGVIWYDTTNNVIKRHNGSSWVSGFSLPFAKLGTGAVIKQVFNGFGFIGSHNFRLPGLGGLAPNGKNADGTLKNTKWTLTTVRVDQAANSTGSFVLIGGNAGLRNQAVATYFEQPTKPTVTAQFNAWYDTENNYIYYTNDTGATWIAQPTTVLGIEHVTSGKVDSLDTKRVFHAVDYSVIQTITNNFNTKADLNLSNTVNNIDFIIDEAETTSGNDYTWYRKYRNGWVVQGGIYTITTEGLGNTFTIPVEMSNANYTIVSGKWGNDMSGVGINIEPYTSTQFKAGVAHIGDLTRKFGWIIIGKMA